MFCDCCDREIKSHEAYYVGYDELNISNRACYDCAKRYPWLYLVQFGRDGSDRVLIDAEYSRYWRG